MNYLAHLALSGADAHMRAGGFLGDWLKGPLHLHTDHWPAGVIVGLQRHRQIDAWIDRQPETIAAMATLGPRYRRLAGPVIDIAFDHLLAQQFSHWHHQPLPAFCADIFSQLAPLQAQMPAGAQRFLVRAQQHQLFERYGEPATFYQVVGSLRQRLSKPQLLAGVETTLAAQQAAIATQFSAIYPKLLRYVNTLEAHRD